MKKLLALAIILVSLSLLFYFKLGQSSLVSFDEAWYASISRNLLSSGDLFNLKFNDRAFVDHPPVGFWLIASTQGLFGIDEFGSRAASAFAGLLTLAIIFIFGSLLFHPAVGIASVFALASSPWFLYRARSGNLDIFLSLFYLLTLLLAWKAAKNTKYIGAFFVGLTALLLTKTASPWTIIPALIFIFWKSPVIRSKNFIISLSLSLVTILSYFLLQFINVPDYLGRLLFVGAPKIGQASLISNILLVKTYLHLGLGVWFKPAIISLPLFLLFFRKSKSLILFIALVFFLLPFTLSPKTQIWHLIPTYPLLILILFGTVYKILKLILVNRNSYIVFLISVLSISLSLSQIKKNWHEFVDIPAFITDEAILSRIAGKYPYPLSIDENFVPAAVFYSGKTVTWNNAPNLSDFASAYQPILVITHSWRLERDNVPPTTYQTITKDRDKTLILFKNHSIIPSQ